MFHAYLLRGEALVAARQGIDADELCDRSKRRYHEFARSQLLQRVGPADPLFQATVGGSSSQVSPLLQSVFTAFTFCILLDCTLHYCLSYFRHLLESRFASGLVLWRGLSSVLVLYPEVRVPQLKALRAPMLLLAQVQARRLSWADWDVLHT